jgi:hypothetical protein
MRPDTRTPLAITAARRHELTRAKAIQRLRSTTAKTPTPAPIPAGQRATDASLRGRLAAALERNRVLADENARLRRQLARALGDQRSARRILRITRNEHAEALTSNTAETGISRTSPGPAPALLDPPIGGRVPCTAWYPARTC